MKTTLKMKMPAKMKTTLKMKATSIMKTPSKIGLSPKIILPPLIKLPEILLMSSHLDRHRITDVKPDMLSGVQYRPDFWGHLMGSSLRLVCILKVVFIC